MNSVEFNEAYKHIAKRAVTFIEKARREGLLSLEDNLDKAKAKKRDIFEYGMMFAIDGTDSKYIEKILSNIINQEKDNYMIMLKTIQKEAVLAICEGVNPRMLINIINSYSEFSLDEDEIFKEYLNEDE